MSLFNIPEDDRWLVWITAIVCATLVALMTVRAIRINQEYFVAFSNGYEQVCDPETHETLWKKSSKE